VEKVIEKVFFKQNIQSGFRAIWIWPINKVIYERTKLKDVYIIGPTNISNENNENPNDAHDDKEW
jgi:hypothetical protein